MNKLHYNFQLPSLNNGVTMVYYVLPNLFLMIQKFKNVQNKQLSSLLDEDPAVMERRSSLAKRLELYRNAQAEIDAVAWAK